MLPNSPWTVESKRTGRFELATFTFVILLLFGDAWFLLGEVGAYAHSLLHGLSLDRAIVVASVLVLAACAYFSRRRGGVDAPIAFVIGAATGLLFFARTLGSALADPTAIGWLLKGDLAQHFSGWHSFRHVPWAWPPGALPEVWYPVGTAIVFTDSLPLLALLLKPFSPWLADPFQYIGLWLLVNCTMQGAFGALLVARETRSAVAVLAGAMLFVVAPVFLNRFGHDTLTTQWLLLAALWLYFRSPPPRLVAEAWPWWLLTAAILVHPYLGAMTLAIQGAYWARRSWIDRDRSVGQAGIGFAGSLVLTLVFTWLAGAMTLPHKDTGGGLPYGPHSFNLLGFFNPMGYSRVLPTLPSLRDQYEGFAYLGLGMLVLTIVAIGAALLRRRPGRGSRRWRPLVVVALATAAFAASSVLAIGGWTLIDRPIGGPILASFRASGRFIWIAYYALMVATIWTVLRRFGPRTAAALLITALLAQLWDFSLAHRRYATLRVTATDIPAGSRLQDAGWDRLAAGRHHLTFLPPLACGHQSAPYLPFQLFAADHSMTFNAGYLARWNGRGTGRYCVELGAQLAAGRFSADDLYVVGAEWHDAFHETTPSARCETLEGYEVCTVPAVAAEAP